MSPLSVCLIVMDGSHVGAKQFLVLFMTVEEAIDYRSMLSYSCFMLVLKGFETL